MESGENKPGWCPEVMRACPAQPLPPAFLLTSDHPFAPPGISLLFWTVSEGLTPTLFAFPASRQHDGWVGGCQGH